MSWAEVIDAIRADAVALLRSDQRLWRASSNRGAQALAVYRVARYLDQRGVRGVPVVLTRLVQMFLGLDLSLTCVIEPGVQIVHGFGLVVGNEAVVRSGVTLYHGVTLGDRGSEWVGSDRIDGHPTIGRGAIVGAGAKILGPVRVGDGAVIGANAVVLADVPIKAIVAGVPGRVVGTRR